MKVTKGVSGMSCMVELIAHTTDAPQVVAAGAKLCYSPSSASGIMKGLDAADVASFLKKLRAAGHASPFEHASFTFAIDGLSRVASHQLVRHRIASYSQQSQRYVSVGGSNAVCPPTIAADPEASAVWEEHIRASREAYGKLSELGIPREDARFILPHGWETSLVMTMNARELHHFFGLRLCRRAQWEIRALAGRMLVLVREAAYELFDPAGPACVAGGGCAEAHPCGRPYAGVEGLLAELRDERGVS